LRAKVLSLSAVLLVSLAALPGTASSATVEDITFVPGLLNYKMRYTNRPTGIQQVLSFSGHAQGDG
jgi:hypothetical protein